MQTQTIYLGAGCYWSKEYYLSRLPGVTETQVGFAGGHQASPTYAEVCGKQTGHAEVVAVSFAPQDLSLYDLLRHFFKLHDAGQDRRGKGGQYRSAVFFPKSASPEDTATVNSMIDFLRQQGLPPTTEVREEVTFYLAEDRHQGYCERLENPPKAPQGFPLESWPNQEELVFL